MEILNKKQKIVLAIIGILIILFIGYYIIRKVSDYKDYDEIETIEENNIEIRHF